MRIAAISLALVTLVALNRRAAGQSQGNAQPLHVRNSFQFTLAAPLTIAAPLFGPQGERCWAGKHWNPEFLHPLPATDVEGAVFTVTHDSLKSTWVNTRFELETGNMQYVAFVPDEMVSVVEVRLTPEGALTTKVQVTYSRTALSPSANDHIATLGTSDARSGPHWQTAIESCLKTVRANQ